MERRLRRSALRSHLQKLDAAHQRTEQHTKSQISQLKTELHARDREIYELQNATIVMDTERVCDLEQQVVELEARLKAAEADAMRHTQHGEESATSSRRTSVVDWTLAARDPFEEDMDFDMEYDAGDEDVFGDKTMAQLHCSTPTRMAASASFPTPPATSPCELEPETPSFRRSRTGYETPPTPAMANAGVQAHLPDPEKQQEIESLQLETSKLTATLEKYNTFMGRVNQRLPKTSDEQNAEVVDQTAESMMELRIESMLRTLSDRTVALTTLTSSISSLGFSGDDASDMLTSLSKAFREARLELEYLTPGEIALPLTSHGAEVLDLLLERLRELAKRVKEGDDAVDEYHEIELNLRQQLEARVSAMDDLKGDLMTAQTQIGDETTRVKELQTANDRLKGAVEGYIRDIGELERLVEKMEAEAGEKDTTIADRDATVVELENRVSTTAKEASDLQDELEVAQASRKKHLAVVNRRSGEALALRDARVAELREEIHRVNEALREAHETIRKLRLNYHGVEEENQGLRDVVEGMKLELQRVMKMSEALFRDENGEVDDATEGAGKFLSSGLARRRSGKKRKRYDSGLGFLDEEEVDDGE